MTKNEQLLPPDRQKVPAFNPSLSTMSELSFAAIDATSGRRSCVFHKHNEPDQDREADQPAGQGRAARSSDFPPHAALFKELRLQHLRVLEILT